MVIPKTERKRLYMDTHEHNHDCDCGCCGDCEEREDIITLYDESGTETDYVIIDGVEYKEKMYLALVEAAHENDEECEFIILRADTDENGEDYFNTIDNEEEFNEVVALLQKKMDEAEDGFELEVE